VIVKLEDEKSKYSNAMNFAADSWCQDQTYDVEIEPEQQTCVANYSMYRADFIIEVRPKTYSTACDSANMCIGFSVLTDLSYNSYFKEVRGEHVEYGNGYSREHALKDFEMALKTFHEKYPTTDYDYSITNGTERLEYTLCNRYQTISAKTETRHYSTGKWLANESKIECLDGVDTSYKNCVLVRDTNHKCKNCMKIKGDISDTFDCDFKLITYKKSRSSRFQ